MKKARAWAVLMVVLAATALIRIRLISTPLERDEGEYAYAGQLMLQGIPPYRLACNMKLPGTYAAYAAILRAFGQTTVAIHLGLLLVNAGAIVLIFLLGRKLFSTWAGLAACAAYALMSLGAGVLGTQAHATHFVVLAALAGFWLLLRFEDSGRGWKFLASGLLFGIAFLMKQPGIVFGIFAAAYLAAMRRWRNLPVFLAGAAVPFAVTCLLLWRAGVFDRFWFWTFTYASHYGTENSLRDGLAVLAATFGPILQRGFALWALAAAGLWMAVRDRRFFVPALLVFGFAGVCPGLYFRPHYVVLMLPAIALLAGSAVRGWLSAGIFVAALAISLFLQWEVLFRMGPVDISRELYGMEPFPEAIPVAAYIRDHTGPQDPIAVLGSEPEIYFYAHRHSATSYLYTEPMVEPQPFAQRMQDDMIAQLERNQPVYLVRFPIAETLSLGGESHLSEWWSEYGPKHYRLVGIADIMEDGSSVYRWDAAAGSYQPHSLYHLAVYRRN
ncbi:MAG TPA: glycosyltransferase family 39 protein [Bryobacteraceae bacterium]|nr:glycosyltransferase family 39 protein [Bryobacteraceae bacterium]